MLVMIAEVIITMKWNLEISGSAVGSCKFEPTVGHRESRSSVGLKLHCLRASVGQSPIQRGLGTGGQEDPESVEGEVF